MVPTFEAKNLAFLQMLDIRNSKCFLDGYPEKIRVSGEGNDDANDADVEGACGEGQRDG
jgi:hypothetical protein